MLSPKAMDILDRLTSAITKIANDGLDIRIHGGGGSCVDNGPMPCGPENLYKASPVKEGAVGVNEPPQETKKEDPGYEESSLDTGDWASEETEDTPPAAAPPAHVDPPVRAPIPMEQMTINELKAEIKKLGAKRLPQNKEREWYLQKLEGMKKGDDQDIPPEAPHKIITGEEAKTVVMQYHSLEVKGCTGHDLILNVTGHVKLKEINELPDGDFKNGLFRKLYDAAVAGLKAEGVKV